MRFLMSIILFMLIGWSIGLAWFVGAMPSAPTSSDIKTDVTVVLTGGNGRVERGFAMLAEEASPILFISGVGSKVTLPEMLAVHANLATREAIRARGALIVLGHAASTTRTNAEEVAEFARGHEWHSVRLITAHYHMTRSLIEFRHALPGITLIADSVFPDGFRRAEWWRHQNTRRLLMTEYHKTLAALLRPWM